MRRQRTRSTSVRRNGTGLAVVLLFSKTSKQLLECVGVSPKSDQLFNRAMGVGMGRGGDGDALVTYK
jgi:hypothetical protein